MQLRIETLHPIPEGNPQFSNPPSCILVTTLSSQGVKWNMNLKGCDSKSQGYKPKLLSGFRLIEETRWNSPKSYHGCLQTHLSETRSCPLQLNVRKIITVVSKKLLINSHNMYDSNTQKLPLCELTCFTNSYAHLLDVFSICRFQRNTFCVLATKNANSSNYVLRT